MVRDVLILGSLDLVLVTRKEMQMNKPNGVGKSFLQIAGELEEFKANLEKLSQERVTEAAELAAQAKRLETMLAKVKGTRELPARRPIDPTKPFFVGEECSTPDLIDAVQRCIADRPHTLREIVDLVGCTNRNRVSGALVKIQVANPKSVKNLGSRKTALWWFPTPKKTWSSKTER